MVNTVLSTAPSKRFLKQLPALSLLAIVVSTILFPSFFLSNDTCHWLHIVAHELADLCRDRSTQYLIVFFLTVNFVMLLILRFSKDRIDARADIIIGISIVFILLSYGLSYETAPTTTKVPILLAGIIFGEIIRWARWQKKEGHEPPIRFITLFSGLMTIVTLWAPGQDTDFRYREIVRWGGIWNSPNLYGALMGTAAVLAIGQSLQSGAENKKSPNAFRVIHFFAAIVCAYGLFKSYSRGAWLGTTIGLVYLLPHAGRSSKYFLWFYRYRLFLVVILISIATLAFWQFRFSEWQPVHRVLSVTNANDFSWRNRLAAWNGAVHMMVDRPALGFGWGQAESTYSKDYCPPQLDEGTAIQLNDFLMIGISAGIPALLCFVGYLFISFRRTQKQPFSIFTVCRAGAIVLLVDFWFDGGLFKLSVGPIFWILMELSRLEPPKTKAESGERKVENEIQSEALISRATSQKASLSFVEIWLRRSAWILGTVAFLQTAIYLGVPFFSVSHSTLAFTRKCLIPGKEISDVDYLAMHVDWNRKPLRTLLQHANLANYNRQIIDWKLDDTIYQQYVLTPTIDPDRDGTLHWRRALWENFYPRIRKETNPASAAQITVQQLHSRVKLIDKGPVMIEGMWKTKTASAAGFEALSVATLRSIGVPARLNDQQKAEFFNGVDWRLVSTLLPP